MTRGKDPKIKDAGLQGKREKEQSDPNNQPLLSPICQWQLLFSFDRCRPVTPLKPCAKSLKRIEKHAKEALSDHT
jgi:hypothetical protein